MARRVVHFVGGGTGGTVGPGIAIAERLRERDPHLDIRFTCSDRPVDRRLLDPGDWTAIPTPARSPSRRPVEAWRFLRGWRATRRIFGQALVEADGPRRVVALGGFVCPPAVLEASRRGVPVDLVNLDAVVGRANRFVARRAERVFSAVPADLRLDEPPVGVPLRRASLPAGSPADARTALGLDPDRRTLLVTGASQGARSIDEFIADFVGTAADSLAGWQVIHLAGGGIERLEAAYRDAAVPATVRPFLEGMGLAWTAADLAISRGGASSIAEISESRTPAIILPYPWHADRHQARNAEGLAELGLVEILDDPSTGEVASSRLGDALRRLLSNPAELDRRRDAVPPSGIDAADRLATLVLERLA